ncbi:MAG: preprotein translocase subunit SecA [Bacteroidota bacterium]|jgi:hypothetical protein
MFNFLRKKNKGTAVTDKIVLSMAAKWSHLFEQWQKDKKTIFVGWFAATVEEMQTFFNRNTDEKFFVALGSEVAFNTNAGNVYVFIEHHPLIAKEVALYQHLQLTNAIVYSSLQEPLFQQFGGDKIIQVLQKLGIKEDELIEHTMISSAIKKAQEKIKEKVTVDFGGRSAQEWLQHYADNIRE